jgi:PAS domain S-box-containing protein
MVRKLPNRRSRLRARLRGVPGLGRNATAAGRERARLRESEERFRLTFDNSPIGMALVALDGTFTRVNHALCEIVGYEDNELTGLRFQQITHPDDLDLDLELAGRLYRGEIPRYQMEKRYIRKDGTLVDVMLHGSVLRNEQGEPQHFIAEVVDISAAKRHEEEMRLASERQELALAGADLSMWDWDISTGNVTCNPRWALIRGYEPGEIRPHFDTWRSGVHPDDWPEVERRLLDHFAGHADFETEHRVRTRSGQWIWILGRGKVFARNAHGEPLRMTGTEADITTRKRMEEALRVAEAKAAGIVSIAADAIICIDREQRITLFNDAAAVMFGRSAEEAIGAPVDVLIPERLCAAHRQHVEAFAAGEATAKRIVRNGTCVLGLRKGGVEFPAEAAVSKLEVDGELILTVVMRDITEQLRREHEQRFLAEVGPLLATTLDYEATLTGIAELTVRDLADVCIIDIVEDGQVRRLQALARDPAKRPFAETLLHMQLDRTRPHLVWSVLQTGKPLFVEHMTDEDITGYAQGEEHLRALRGLEPASLIAVPLLVADKLLGVLVLVSSGKAYGASDLALAEELARRAALSLENARLYLAAKRAITLRNDVLGIVAHDLRNPLQAIVMQASMLCPSDAAPELSRSRPAMIIERAARRMSRLIEDLLDVAQMEGGRLPIEPGPLRPEQLVRDTVDALEPVARAARIAIEVDLPSDLPALHADGGRLTQVLENLIGNAIKFSAPGGRIRVSVTARDDDLTFCVADTGPGIAAEDVPRLFDWFWQARRARRGGAGLGLSIVKGIVEAHGGRVWVQSTPGKGSMFYFTLPLPSRAEAAVDATVAPPSGA